MDPVENLNNKIKRLRKEIDEIQKNCKHGKEEIRWVDQKEYRWCCIKCQKVLSWPSPSEIEKYCGR